MKCRLKLEKTHHALTTRHEEMLRLLLLSLSPNDSDGGRGGDGDGTATCSERLGDPRLRQPLPDHLRDHPGFQQPLPDHHFQDPEF